MPVKPKPFVIECSHCGWKQYAAPTTDVLLPKHCPEQCPRCHFAPLSTRAPSAIESVEGYLERFIDQLKKEQP